MMPDIGQSTFLNWLMAEDNAKQEQVRAYRAYYDGDPPTFLTSRQAAFLNIDRDKGFGANVSAVIVDTAVERLSVTGYEVREATAAGATLEPTPDGEDGPAPTEQIAALLDTWHQQNRMDARQDYVYRAALRDREAFVIVAYDGDKGHPTYDHDFAYDGTNGVKVHYQPGTYDELAFASKRWVVDLGPLAGKMRRLNLYFENRIEKWMSQSDPDGAFSEAFWRPYDDPDDETLVSAEITDDAGRTYLASVSWWTDNGQEDGEPLGVPVVPFINKDDGTGRGKSDLDDALPLQDGINKTYLDLIAAADMTGWQMYWTNGVLPDNWKIYPGAMLPVGPPDGAPDDSPTIGILPAGDLSGLIQFQNWQISVLSGISSTPQSRFTPAAVRPAEGTQQQEESDLVAKVEGLQKHWGNGWEDVSRLALKVARAFGSEGVPDSDGLIISAVWADAQKRNEQEHVATVADKRERLDVPKKQAWREVGYTQADIDEMEQMSAEESDARVQEASVTDRAQQTNALESIGRLMGGNGAERLTPNREMNRL
jgi:hypothetical protein